MLTFLNSRCQEKNARVLSMKKTLPFKTIKKIALVDTRPDLYLILRFLCVPLEESHVSLVVRVPHFENRWPRWLAHFGLVRERASISQIRVPQPLLAIFHCVVQLGSARLVTAQHGSVRVFSTALEWAGLFTCRYSGAASTAVTSS